MVRIWAFLAPVLMFLAGCGAGASGAEDVVVIFDAAARDGAAGDAGAGGDASMPCANGEWVCRATGVASQCDGRGGLSEPIDCAAMGMTCVPQLGCRVCAPGTGRCDPAAADHTQRCSDDGLSWVTGEACNTSGGYVCDTGVCRVPCNAADGDACEFWSVVTPNSQLDPRFPFGLLISNAHDYPVTVTVSGGALSTPIAQDVMPRATAALQLPWVSALSHNRPDCFASGASSLTGACVSRSVLATNAGYHVESNGPVTIAQFGSLEYRDSAGLALAGDASLLLPMQRLGTRYVVGARENQTRTLTDEMGHPIGSVTLGGYFSVTATDPDPNGTHVTVVLSAAARDPLNPTAVVQAGAHTYPLRRGDVLQFVGSAMSEDLTGSTVEADHVVAVFAGHDCAEVPDGRARCNHLEEQLPPADAWGAHYVVSQPRDRGTQERYRVRIVSAAQGNALTFDGIVAPAECAAALGVGGFCEFETAKSFQVTGTGPMQVFEFALGVGGVTQCDSSAGTSPPDRPECAGDPAMTLVQPIEAYQSSYDFAVPEAFNLNLLNVTAPDGAQLMLDGVPIDQTNAASAGAGYKVYFEVLFPGAHHISCTDSTQSFGLQVYGVAPWTQYMYPGGWGGSSLR